MIARILRAFGTLGILTLSYPLAAQSERIFHVDLAYRAPGNGPAPNFTPRGTEVKLADFPADTQLPAGATRPAKTGTVEIGPDQKSWIKILVTADPSHAQDLTRLYIDANRNGVFDDEQAISANLSLNEKTKATWSSFNGVKFSVLYGGGIVEPYMVDFWAVRAGTEIPSTIRYTVHSWRSGTVKVDGVEGLVAVFDSDNDAMFGAKDEWSVLTASEKDATRRLLLYTEAKRMNRFMFLRKRDGKELVLEFRSLSPDGRSLTFAVVDRMVTKAQDRAPDDTLAAERARPRTTQPFPWIEGKFDKATGDANVSGRRLIVDFWTDWCGPCRSMDEWIWTDAEVASVLNAGFVGVKLDGDVEKVLVRRFHVEGFPTVIVLDPSGKEIRRFSYASSKEMLELLKR